MASERSQRSAICRLFYSSAIASLGFIAASPAHADAPPPERFVIDQNGVDLARGTYRTRQVELAIGIDRSALSVMVSRTSDGPSGPDFDLGVYGDPAYEVQVAVMGQGGQRSLVFGYSAGAYFSKLGDGATLTLSGNIYTLKLSDGSQYKYDNTITSVDTNRIARVTEIKLATGETITMAFRRSATCTNPFQPGCSQGFTTYKVRLQSVVSSFGYQLQYDYLGGPITDPSWNTIGKITAFNRAVDYCDPAGNIPCSFSKSWPSVTYGYSGSGSGQTWTVTDALSRVTTYTGTTIRRPGSGSDNETRVYNAGLISSVTVDGRTWQYAFTLVGHVRTAVVTNPDGTHRTVVSDTLVGLPTSVTDETGKTTTYSYDTNGRLSIATTPDGIQTKYTYDARGNVTEQRLVSRVAGDPDIVTTAGFDTTCTNVLTCNQPNWTKDANGNQTDYTYDATHGGVLTVTQPAASAGGVRPKLSLGYSTFQSYFKDYTGAIVASGVPTYFLTSMSTCKTQATCAGTGDETKTQIGYGPQTAGTRNNLLPVSKTVSSGDGTLAAMTTTAYDDIGNIVSMDGPLSGSDDTSQFSYDADRELVADMAPDPDGAGALKRRATRYTYNPDGKVTLTELGTVPSQATDWTNFTPSQSVQTTYDASGRKATDALIGGSTTTGLIQYSYDTSGRPDCTAMRMNPGAFGSLPASACTLGTAGSSGPDRITKKSYDDAGRTTKVTSAYGTSVASDDRTITYTNDGLVGTVTDAEGNKTSYSYDGYDRLSAINYPNGTKGSGVSSSTDKEQLTYDANGNVTTRVLRGGALTIGYSYDNLNRLTYKNLPGSEPDISYAYDLMGRLTTATDANSNFVGFAYDALGRATAQSSPLGVVGMSYDLAGRRTSLVYPDNFYVTYDYQVSGELKTIKESGTTTLATYAYDDLGRRTSLTRGNGVTTTYGYDSVSRLSSLATDLTGTTNDLTLGYSYNPASQVTSTTRSNNAYSWTGAANLARNYTSNGLNQYSANTSLTFGYDARGNLTSSGTDTYTYSSENLLLTGPNSAALSYDPLMRLYQASNATNPATNLLYDGDQPIGLYAVSSGTGPRYVNGPGGELVVEYTPAGVKRWATTDERGSVIGETDSSGNSLGINTYDEYGVPGSANSRRVQYTGQFWLPELGMYYYKARIYSPTLGRFMQTDPIGYGDGMNWYNYVGSDPVNSTDSSGTCNEFDGYTGCADIVINGSGVLNGSGFSNDGGAVEYKYGMGHLDPAMLTLLRNMIPTPLDNPPEPGKDEIVIHGSRSNGKSKLPYAREPNPRWPANMQPNGCTGVPDIFPQACNSHDVCYETVGVSKERCDSEFYVNMVSEHPSLENLARTYYEGVKNLSAAKRAYDDAQRMAREFNARSK